jgi:hypothetical protein
VTDRLAIDLLFGSERPRRAIDAGVAAEDIVASFAADEQSFVARRRDWLLY